MIVADTEVEASLSSVGKRPDGFGRVYSPDSLELQFKLVTPLYFRGRIMDRVSVFFSNNVDGHSEQRRRRHLIGNALGLLSAQYQATAMFDSQPAQETPPLGLYDLSRLVDKGQIYKLHLVANLEDGKYRVVVAAIDSMLI